MEYKTKKCDILCEVCGNMLKNVTSRRRFCNERCRLQYHQKLKIGVITIICPLCDKIEIKSYCNQRYCLKCIPLARKLQKKKDLKKYYLRNKKKCKHRASKWKTKNSSYNPNLNETKKYKARFKANYKIKIPNGLMCEECKKNIATQKHHEDYNKPLEIKFLCIKCHQKHTNEDNKDQELERFIKITGGLGI